MRKSRQQIRSKLDANTPLKVASPRYQMQLPPSVDLNHLVHQSNLCIASYTLSAEWVHSPMVRFVDRRRLGKRPKYEQQLIFNDECHRQFGLVDGCQIHVYLAPSMIRPDYLILQNTLREFDAPAHCHRVGAYRLRELNASRRVIVKPGGRHAWMGLLGRQSLQYPWALFDVVPGLHNHYATIAQIKGHPNLLGVELKTVRPVPTTILAKTVRVGPLARDRNYALPPTMLGLPWMG